jgi:hypothetical protein
MEREREREREKGPAMAPPISFKFNPGLILRN